MDWEGPLNVISLRKALTQSFEHAQLSAMNDGILRFFRRVRLDISAFLVVHLLAGLLVAGYGSAASAARGHAKDAGLCSFGGGGPYKAPAQRHAPVEGAGLLGHCELCMGPGGPALPPSPFAGIVRSAANELRVDPGRERLLDGLAPVAATARGPPGSN